MAVDIVRPGVAFPGDDRVLDLIDAYLRATDPSTGAAATEKASILRYIARVRSRIPGTPGILADVQRLFSVFIDEMERAIESNAHHEAPK